MLLVKTDNTLGPAFDNFKLLCKHSCSAVSPHCFTKSGSWEHSASALAAPWRCTPQCPPLLLLASSGQDKSDFEGLGLASSRHMCWAQCLWPNMDLGPWRYVSTSGLSLCGVSPAQLQMCWYGSVMVSQSSAAPHTNSHVLSTAWAWHEVIIATLPNLESLGIFIH